MGEMMLIQPIEPKYVCGVCGIGINKDVKYCKACQYEAHNAQRRCSARRSRRPGNDMDTILLRLQHDLLLELNMLQKAYQRLGDDLKHDKHPQLENLSNTVTELQKMVKKFRGGLNE